MGRRADGKPITTYAGSWADLTTRKAFPPVGPSQHPIHHEQDKLMRQQGFTFDERKQDTK